MTRSNERVRLTFLLMRADGTGGVPRTVLNLANHLVEHFDVRVISVNRKRNRPVFETDPRIQVQYLVDYRPAKPRRTRLRGFRRATNEAAVRERRERIARGSQLAPLDPKLSEEGDRALKETLSALEPGILIPTRPALSLIAGRYAPPGVTIVGQDHLTFSIRTRGPGLAAMMREAISGLDAFVPLTEGDANDYRKLLPDAKTVITPIPNALSWPMGNKAPLSSRVVVTAGRLERQKAFHRLIDAYAPVTHQRPDWRLDIYGVGEEREALAARIDRLGVGEHVKLRGYTRELPEVLAGASVYAMSSIYEGFPMVLLEAMTVGLPMIAYDCPRGPAELIRDGVSGLVIPDGDTAAYTQGLLRLLDDEDLRRSMGAAAWEDAHKYQMTAIVDRWLELLNRVHQPHSSGT